MLSFDQGDLRFNVRAVGVIFNQNQVLLHKLLSDRFWALPGGRVEFLEPARDTIKREMQEELGIDVRVEKLLWVVENFFKHNDKSYHEVGFYFLISSHSHPDLYTQAKAFKGIENDKHLIFQWHHVEALEDIELQPKFLQTSLKSLPQVTEYLVHYG
ncbi:MAG TPA: NUDIX hydrolase [Waterburya sp.]|jgi:8-oxo-dGTP pyrophosphatase MutT (NUDIX family)